MSIQKYLEKYADLSDAKTLDDARARFAAGFDHVVIIPARNENQNIDATLKSIRDTGAKALIVVVVNASEQCSRAIIDDNRALCERLKNERDVWVIERNHAGAFVPKKGGVGTARKIGADHALYFMHHQIVKSSLLAFTDADAKVPGDYFTRIDEKAWPQASAFLFPLEHDRAQDEAQRHALCAYEISFRLYALGLQYARSPYAFLTVGSVIVVEASAYAAVRGVPKKAAGEDFHLLNKLAKCGDIVQLKGDALVASSRFSQRVPFGTGQAVKKAHARMSAREVIDWPSDDFVAFEILREGLCGLEEAIEKGTLDGVDFKRAHEVFSAMNTFEKISPLLLRPKKNRRLAVHSSFDALRTLQFTHYVRDHIAQALPALQAFARSRFGTSSVNTYESALALVRKESALLSGARGAMARKEA